MKNFTTYHFQDGSHFAPLAKLAVAFIFCFGFLNALQAQISVTATAGTMGPTPYTTLKGAFDAINAGTHQGVITIDVQGNTTETASAVLNASGNGPASYTSINVTPSGGAGRTITGAIAGHLIDLNGADNVTFNGLNTGGNSLTLSNTNTGAVSTIRFIADATNNTVTNCIVQGSGTSTTNGTILFSTGTTTGNDGNTISNSDIGPAGSNLHLNAITSIGSSTTIDNSGISILNNNVFDFFSAGSTTQGIFASTGSSGWTINNNRLYQTATRTYTTGNIHAGIRATTGSGYTINNNTIGYASNTQTGVYTMAGTVATRFVAIDLAVGTTPAVSNVQGNTIASFMLNTSSTASTAPGVWCGVNATAGNVNIGTTSGNTIGSGTGNGSITTTSTGSAGIAIGINYSGTIAANISNNTIGSFTVNGSTTSIGAGFSGILVTAGIPTVTNNLIGSNSTANSIHSPTVATGTQLMFGINISGVTGAAQTTITGNTISNMTAAGTATASAMRGIQYLGTGFATISNNTIKNLASASAMTTFTAGQVGVQGICHGGTAPAGSTVTQNTIFNIAATNTGAVASVAAGIGFSNPTGASVTRNQIYDIKNASTGTTATAPPLAIGILIRAFPGATLFANNMITLGTGQTTNTQFVGFLNNFSTIGPLQFYHNSVHIEGTAAAGALPSYALQRGDNTAASAIITLMDIKNNIFNNTRNGGTGKHYAIANTNATAPNQLAGWGTGASNFNVLNGGIASTVGLWGATDQSFATWKTTSNGDFCSHSGVTVTFTNPAVGDLHLNFGASPTPLESGGANLSQVTIDYDNQARPGPAGSTNGGGTFMPDLGADEFDGVPNDLTCPIITYSPIVSCSSSDITLAGVNIQDHSGVPTTGTLRPRIYYRKGAGSWFSQPGTLSGGTANNGTWSFTIVVADMGGVISGDVISYYVIAQDVVATPNIGSNPAGAAATDVNMVTTPPATPSTYTVATSLSGTFNVGAGGDYATLTAAVAAYNAGCISGPITFNLTDMNYNAGSGETFPIIINANAGASSANRLTIKPAPGNTATISGSSASAIITLNGADYVTIDGSNSGGTDRSLTISNTNAATLTAAISIASLGTGAGATNNVVKNTNLSTGGNTSTLVTFGISMAAPTLAAAGTGADNDNNEIRNNNITSAYVGIYSAGLLGISTGGNDNLTIADNIVGPATAAVSTNIGFAGVLVANALNVAITGNTVRNVSATVASTGGIIINTTVSNLTISQNTVNDIFSSGATGSGTTSLTGIYVGPNVFNATVTRNTVTRVENTNPGGWGARGIMVNTTINQANNVTLSNNMVSDIVSYSDASTTASFSPIGIAIEGGTSANLYYNSVNLFGAHPGLSATATVQVALYLAATVHNMDIRNNILVNTYDNSSSTTEKSFSIFSAATSSAPFSTINYNDYYVAGAAGILGNLNATDLTTFAALQAAYGQNANSISADPKFITNTDLHISTTLVTPVESAGTPIAGVTIDFDGNARNATTPDIGADEGTFIAPPMNDVQATAFIDPVNGGSKSTGVPFSPQASFTNNGTLAQTNVPVRYKIIGPSPATTVVYNMTATIPSLASNATATATFPPATIASPGTYTIRAIAQLPGDQTPANDSISGTITAESPLAGNYNIGASQAFPYDNLTNAFTKLNGLGVSAPVTFSLLADYTSTGETFPLTINAFPGASATNTFTLKPASGVTASITGSSSTGLIILNGADYVIIDGSNGSTANTVCPPSAASRDLTITNTNTGTSSAVIWLQTTGSNGATNNIIKNLNIAGNTNTQTLFGIGMGSTTISTSSLGTDNDNNQIVNNNISKTQYGIYTQGASTANKNTGNVINQNLMNTSSPNNVARGGIWTGFEDNITISGNTVSEVSQTSSPDVFGITCGFGTSMSATTSAGNEVTNATITKNVIGSIVNSGTFSATGISVSAATSGITTIANNMIYGVAANGTSGDIGIGMVLGGGTGSTTRVYYNTVAMQGTIPGATAASQTSACLAVTNSTPPVLDIKNNIFSNKQLGNTGATSLRLAAIALGYSSTVGNYVDLTSNYNDLYSAGAGPGTYVTGITGGVVAGTSRVTLADWQTETGRDANSVAFDPIFVSSTNLHLDIAFNNSLNAAATPLGTVTDDFDCEVRSVLTPDIGADEIFRPCMLTSAGVANILCNDNGTPSNPADDRITFTLNPTGTDLGSTYSVSVSSGSVSPTSGTYGAPTTFTMQAGSAGGGSVTVTVSDPSGGGCSVMGTVTDPGTCSTQCGLTSAGAGAPMCNNNGTPSLPTDDRRTFTLNPTGFNLGATYTVTVNNGGSVSPTSGTYGVPTTFTLQTGSAGNAVVYTVTVTDASGAPCTATATISDPGSCSTTCGLTSAGAGTPTCNSNGTPGNPADDRRVFTLNPTGNNLGATYTVTVNNGGSVSPTSGTYGSATTFTMQTGSAGNAVTYTVTVTDASGAPCTVTATISDPGSCSASCNLASAGAGTPMCNNNGTPSNPTDDRRTFTLNPTGFNLGATYTVSVNNAGSVSPTSGTYGSATTFTMQNGSAGNAIVYTVTVTDASGAPCTATATISDPGSCSTTCGLTNAGAGTPTCNNNGTPSIPTDDRRVFTLNPTGFNLGATYTVSVNNGGSVSPTSGTYGSATTFTMQTGSAGNGTVYTVTVTDASGAPCTATATISDPGSCSSNCSMTSAGAGTPTCNNNSTPSNPMDDRRVFTLNPTGTNLGATYTVTVNNGGTVSPTSGTYGSPTTFTMQTGSAGNAVVYTVTVTDASGAPCTATATISDPGSCSTTCGLTSAGAGTPTCNNNGTPTIPTDDRRIFTLNPTGFNIGATYTVSVNNGGTVSPTSGTYGSATTFTMQTGSAGNGATYTVTVTDASGAPCTATATISDPGSCSTNCSMSSAGAGTPTCNNNATPSNPTDDRRVFTLNPTGTNLGATYTVTVNNGGTVSPTSGTYGSATTFTMQTGSAGNGTTYTVTVTDASGAPCTATATISDPGSCSTTCGIASAGAGMPTCNNNGTLNNPTDDRRVFTLNPTGFNLGATYTVSVNNGGTVSPTSGTYGSATTFTMQTGSAGNGTIYTVTVTDASGAPCTATATVSDPGSCSPVCNLMSAGAGTPTCNNNSTPSNPTDDRRVFTLNPTGFNLGGTYTVSVNNGGTVSPTSGTYGSATTFTMQTGSAGNGTSYTVTVTDASGAPCTASATISDPGSCSTTCGIASAGAGTPTCNNNGTNANLTDDRRVFTLNPTGFNLGATYTVTVNNGGTVSPTSGTYGSATTFTMQTGSAGNGITYTVTVTDASGAPCTATATISDPGSCSTECGISSITVSNISACDNAGTPVGGDDFFTANVTVAYFNKPSSGFLKITGDGVDSVAVGSIGANSYTFVGVQMSADATPISLTASFTANPACNSTNISAGNAPPSCSGGICQVVINDVSSTPECSNFANGTIFIDAIGTGTLLYSINGGITFNTSPVFNFLQAGTYNIVVQVQGSPTCQTTATETVGSQAMQTWYRDLDNDGYSPGATQQACTQPAGYKLLGDLAAPPTGSNIDCNDNDPNQRPGQTWYKDGDNDGYSSGNTLVQCAKPTGYKLLGQLNAPPVAPNIDCNDNNSNIKPGAAEVCNGIDDNCDGSLDTGAPNGSTFVGNKTFTTQAQVNAWPSCYSIITGTVTIQNSGITNLTPLANIARIDGNLNIKTTGLTNMKGLQGLTKVGGTVNISLNSLNLVNLDSLHNLDTVTGDLKIFQNLKLTGCCSVYELINELPGKFVGGIVSVYGNKTTCLDMTAINAACDPNFANAGSNNLEVIDVTGNKDTPSNPADLVVVQQAMTLFPNPAREELTVQLAKPFQFGRVKMYNLQGNLVMTQELQQNDMQHKFLVGTMPGGVYLVSVVVDGQTLTERLLLIE